MDLSDKLKASKGISLDCKIAEVLGITCSEDGCTQCREKSISMLKDYIDGEQRARCATCKLTEQAKKDLETIMRMEKVIERLYCDLCYQDHPECTQPLCEKSENYANLVMRKK